MDLNDYFDPVSLDKPLIDIYPPEVLISRQIQVHTPDQPIKSLENFAVALLGIPEDRNSANKGCATAPDHIREAFYQLVRFPRKLHMVDLGNLRKGNTITDTYFGLTDVLNELLSRKITPVLLGGSQDLTLAVFRAMKKQSLQVNMVTVDARPDLVNPGEDHNLAFGYLRNIIKERGKQLFNITCIGHQQYYTDRALTDYLEKHRFDAVRLGQARENLRELEPIMRDANLVSIDVSAVRSADAPGYFMPSPNGFYGEEVCQLARYAGLSGNTRAFGLFEMNPVHDRNAQTAILYAQTLWYFLEGLSQKIVEDPLKRNRNIKQYMVQTGELEHELVFYQSLLTNRWWLEVPVKDAGEEHSMVLSCSHEDYIQACSQVITDRVWRIYRKLI
jgi:arginase family enzyme